VARASSAAADFLGAAEEYGKTSFEASRRHSIAMARKDFVAFVSYVMRDEHTGKPIKIQPFQAEWASLCERHHHVLILAFMSSGKSALLSIAMTLWELGRNPTLQFAVVSKTSRQAKKIALTLARYIEESHELKEVFPWLRPDPRSPWNSEQLTVARPGLSKDPSIQIVSVLRTVHGARLDRVVLDDVLDRENTRTEVQRDNMWDWYQKSIPGRMTKDSKIRAVGNPFHKKDLYHRLARNEEWAAYRFPVLLPSGFSAWPDEWPIERIEARRRELGDVEFKVQMMCEAVDISAMGMMFGRHEVQIVDVAPPVVGRPCRRWDLACTEPHPGNMNPDWSVGARVQKTVDKKYLIWHVERARTRDPLSLLKRVANTDGRGTEIGMPQDPGQAGKDQVQSYMRELAGHTLWCERETGDKITRAGSWSTQWMNGNVLLMRGNWNDAFLDVMEAFPLGSHDDDVDASGGAFRHLVTAGASYTGNVGTGYRPRR